MRFSDDTAFEKKKNGSNLSRNFIPLCPGFFGYPVMRRVLKLLEGVMANSERNDVKKKARLRPG